MLNIIPMRTIALDYQLAKILSGQEAGKVAG